MSVLGRASLSSFSLPVLQGQLMTCALVVLVGPFVAALGLVVFLRASGVDQVVD